MYEQRAAPRVEHDRPLQHQNNPFEGSDRAKRTCATDCHLADQTCVRKQSSKRHVNTQFQAHPWMRRSFEASRVLACECSVPAMIVCDLADSCGHDTESCHANRKVIPAHAAIEGAFGEWLSGSHKGFRETSAGIWVANTL